MKLGIIKQFTSVTTVAALTLGILAAPAPALAASADVKEAQTIMTKFGIPAGPIDGLWGSQTARGLCAFRSISGLTVSRNALTATDLTKLRSYNTTYTSLNQIPAPTRNSKTTYLLANQTCQAMTYVAANKYVRVMAISTGASATPTPNGNYSMGGTQRGWSCSTLYPESCATHTEGRFASISNFGNMYNKRVFNSASGLFVHGSTSVPTSPASHGCVRVTITDSDWMYDNVGNSGATYLSIVGAY